MVNEFHLIFQKEVKKKAWFAEIAQKLFLKTLQRMIPSLMMEDIKPGRAGVRALLLSQDGDTRDDFRIEYHGRSIHVLNAPSPAATASLAIGGFIAEEAEKQFNLK